MYKGSVNGGPPIDLFCVDGQLTIKPPDTYPAFVEGETSFGNGIYDIRYENHDGTGGKQFRRVVDGSQTNAQFRYRMAAWLVTNYVSPGSAATVNLPQNRAIQTAIWNALDTLDVNPPNFSLVDFGGGPTGQTAFWFAAAETYVKNNPNAALWSAYRIFSGAVVNGQLSDYGSARQTFIAVPEPSFYALLGVGLLGIGFAAANRRRKSVANS